MEKSAHMRINSISISNFKSVKSVTLSECRRINVLIGRPNVGKSNILEALALFDVPYMVNTGSRSLKSLLRVDNVADLFHNGDWSTSAEVHAGPDALSLSRSGNGVALAINCGDDFERYTFASSLSFTSKKEPAIFPDVLTYFFRKQLAFEAPNPGFLLPPSGANLMDTVAGLPALKADLAELFHGYGLKLVFDSGSRQIKAMKEKGLDMFLVPYGSLADSLQRLIFYKAAIGSNHGKVLCFEEPEAHTFPPYISNVVNDIIECEDNQFFITTHSPYVMNALLESSGNDLAVFVADMCEGATVVKRLSDTQLQQAYDNGMDMFFNIEAYLG